MATCVRVKIQDMLGSRPPADLVVDRDIVVGMKVGVVEPEGCWSGIEYIPIARTDT